MAVPKLRFKADDGSEFPEWEKKKLSDVFVERREMQCIDDEYKLLSFTIEQGVINPEDKKTNKRDFLMKDKASKKFLRTEYNDIVYNPANLKYGAINRNKLGKGLLSPIYAIFYTDQNAVFMEFVVRNPDFIKRSLKYLEGTVVKLMTLKPRDFLRMKTYIPCSSEQQKIADFLSTIDTVIEKQEEIVSAWEERKKGVMQKLFSQEVRFKADDGSEFPEWEEKKFSEIFEKTTNKNTCYGADKIISVANMYYKEDASVSNEDYLKTYNVMLYGDIAFEGHVNKEYSHGRFVLNDIGNGIVSHIFDVFHPKNLSLYSVGFWKEYIRHEPITGRVLVRCTKSSTMMRNLVAKEFLQESVPVPCLAEQQKIADCLSALDDVIEKQKATLAAWEEMKKGLLQQMFV